MANGKFEKNKFGGKFLAIGNGLEQSIRRVTFVARQKYKVAGFPRFKKPPKNIHN